MNHNTPKASGRLRKKGSKLRKRKAKKKDEYDEETELFDKECDDFMSNFVEKIFVTDEQISREDKAQFGVLCQYESGRLWFAKHIDMQRVYQKSVNEVVFFRLIQYFAVVLFECHQSDDFDPARILMNMCFTFYHDSTRGGFKRELLVPYLLDQPIWHSLRFWNAAFFESVQGDRAETPISRDLWDSWSPQEQLDYEECSQNSTFGKLGTFLGNMRAFGLSKEICSEFLHKMGTISSLNEDQIQSLQKDIDKDVVW